MSGLPASLTRECLHVLEQCSEFDNDGTLSSLFALSQELHDFAPQLPQACSKKDRILKTLDFLVGRRFRDGQSVAPFFLRALSDKHGESDRLHADLQKLAQEVDSALAGQGSDDAGIRRDISRKAPSRPLFVVGRSKELEEIAKIVAENRSVGIFGMVGVGKETVAKEAFHRLKELFREHGYSCVEIPNASLEEIRDAIERDFRIGVLYPDHATLKALILLNGVVPNQESLRQLLSLIPNAALIVTSTETWPLDDLYPIHLEPLQPQDAAEMFCTLCRPRVALTPHHKREVIPQICSSLGYLPLAIQIVANRVRVTGRLDRALVQALKSEKERLDALRCGDESVEASFNVSFAALSDADKYLFACLGAFSANTFSCAAANETAQTTDAGDRLFRLATLFLVRSTDEARFSLHPLLKSFAKRKLDELPTANDVKERCARYFFTYILKNRHPLDRLDRDAESIFECLAWCEKEMTRCNKASLLAFLTDFLPTDRANTAWIIYLVARLYKRRREIPIALEYYHQSLTAAEAENVPSLRGACLRSIGEIYVTQLAAEAEGFAYIDQAMDVLSHANDIQSRKELVFTLTMLADYYRGRNDRDRAVSLASESLTIRDMIPEGMRKDHTEGLSYAARIVIESYVDEGNCQAAYGLLEKEWSQLDADRDLGPVLGHVARLLSNNDEFEKAETLFNKAMEAFNNADNAGGCAWICRCRGEMYSRQRQPKHALNEYQDAANYRYVAGERMKTAAAIVDLARAYHRVGNYTKEDTCWKDFTISYEQELLSPRTPHRHCVIEALSLYGDELLCTGCGKVTATNPMLASSLYCQDKNQGDPAHIHHLRGDHYFCRGNAELAEAEYEQAVTVRKEADDPVRLTRTLQAIGDTFSAAGKKNAADNWYRQIHERKPGSKVP